MADASREEPLAGFPPLLTVADVARILNTTKRRVYALVESRDPALALPVVRIGRQLRFRAADLERYLDQRAKAS